MQDQQYGSALHEARRIGAEHGRNAASWVDLPDRETARRILRGIEDGDPEVLDGLPAPDLSGQWADGYTPERLAEDVGLDVEDEDSADVLSDLCDAYEDAFSTTAVDDVEARARALVGVTAEVGTSGESRSVELADDPAVTVAEAVDIEHHCDSSTCDIRASLEAGYPLASAWFLQGATETPLLDAVLDAYGLGASESAEFREWCDYARTISRECPSCGAYTYDEDGYVTHCDNCGAELPAVEDEDDEPEGYCVEHEGRTRGETDGRPWACDNWGRFPQLDCRIRWDGAYVTTSERRYDDDEDDERGDA